jgi:hypothetical protein
MPLVDIFINHQVHESISLRPLRKIFATLRETYGILSTVTLAACVALAQSSHFKTNTLNNLEIIYSFPFR